MQRTMIPILLLILASSRTVAKETIDETRPCHARCQVSIENTLGSVEVVAWDKEQVRVTGRLAAGVREVEIDHDGEGVSIEVGIVPSRGSDPRRSAEAALRVEVPRLAVLTVETINAGVTVRGVEGRVGVETINGAVTITGHATEVEVESMTGDVHIDAPRAEISAESVAGTVTIRGGARPIHASAVAGDVTVHGDGLTSVGVETVAGNVRLEGSLAARGEVRLESHSGRVDVALPRDVEARFRCTTFSGAIRNELGTATAARGKHAPSQELRFSTGGEFEVAIESFSGTVVLRALER